MDELSDVLAQGVVCPACGGTTSGRLARCYRCGRALDGTERRLPFETLEHLRVEAFRAQGVPLEGAGVLAKARRRLRAASRVMLWGAAALAAAVTVRRESLDAHLEWAPWALGAAMAAAFALHAAGRERGG